MSRKCLCYVFILCLPILCYGQYSKEFLNATYHPDGIFTLLKFDENKYHNLITYRELQQSNFKHVREKQMKAYVLMLASAFNFSSKNDLKSVYINNRKKVQGIIDQVNIHADFKIGSKDLMANNFPKGFFFRTPDNVNKGYEAWKKEFSRLGGIYIKALGEELISREQDKILNFANRFAIEYPEQMTVLHFNGRSRDPRWNNSSKFSAGHWLYNLGTNLTESINSHDTIIKVDNSDVFRIGLGIRNANNKNDDIVIVPIDSNGNKIWSEAEQVTLVAKTNGAIKVIRGRYGSKPRSFKPQSTYLAPHASEGPWGDKDKHNLMWYYNLSTACPRDENGDQCSNVLSKEIGIWFKKDGMTFAFDGIQFDIASWTLSKFTLGKRFVDVNVDGIPDKGYVHGRNVFGEGTYNFYKLLREELGENKIIVGDGGVDYGMRAVDVASGMESEGLCDWSDSYKEFAKPLSIFNYWNTYGIDKSFSYVTNKDPDGTIEDRKKRERMVLATATCLGISFNSFIKTPSAKKFRYGILDELKKGVENELYWLGEPVGDLIHVSDKKFHNTIELKTLNIQSDNSTINVQNNDLIVISKESNANSEMKVTFRDVEIAEGDLIVTLNAKTKDSLIGFKPVIPRHIVVKTDVLKDEANTASSVLNYINSLDFLTCRFYFRNVKETKADIEISIEGGGEVILKNIEIISSQLALAREFKNGIVLVNPSTENFTFNLSELFKDSKFKRLQGTSLQNQIINNGEFTSNKVTLPGLSGLFLIKLNKN